MCSVIIGIDPGKQGAIAILNMTGVILEIVDIPVTKVKSSKKVKGTIKNKVTTTLDILNLYHTFYPYTSHVVGLEHVHSMPGNGVATMFSMGESYGAVKACITLAIGEYQLVSPRAWKRHFGLLKTTKKDAVIKALELYPEATDLLVTKRGRLLDGRADALLIARYLYDKSVS